MRKLYFISQYFDIESDKHFGGVLIRKKQIELFSKNYEVHVVMPNKRGKEISVKNNVTYIPYFYQKQICDVLERFNLIADKDYFFAKNTIKYLSKIVTQQDIVFCTTGGSLETLAIGHYLKQKLNCKYVINFQDPINHASVNGLYVSNELRFKRNSFEKKYLSNIDLIITSSDFFKISLIKKYSFLNESNMMNNYYGYFYDYPLSENFNSNPLSLMYAGLFGKHQSVEVIAKILANSEKNLKVFFIGNYQNYKPILPFLNQFNFRALMPHNEFLNFVSENINIGIVSLTNPYLEACVPSKIFEYFNLGLPIIGILPDGDAKELVNKNNFGKIFGIDELQKFDYFVQNELTSKWLQECRINVIKNKHQWHMDTLFQDVMKALNTL